MLEKINELVIPPSVVDIIKNMNMSETQMARDNYYHRLLGIRDFVTKAIENYEKSTGKKYTRK
jgi:hypothetical protein